jgi:hypothetical protein
MEEAIRRLAAERPISAQACLNRAKGFDKYRRFEEYMELYEKIVK